MRIKITKSKSSENFYVIKSTYIDKKHSTVIVEKLGNLESVRKKAKGKDPYQWAKDYANKLTIMEKEGRRKIIKEYSQNKFIEKDKQFTYNGGYLFLQKIYYDLKLNKICDSIKDKYQFKYDLNNILSNLIYSRIIYPSSKSKTLELSKNFIEQPNFSYNDLLRSLEVINKENDFIQSELYKNSLKYSKRNDNILFYDCTNYFFEIEDDDDFRKYGKSKENRPNPIIGMGLFMDGDGIPLTFDTFPGNQNEQPTMKPLENKIINDFNKSQFVVCTDAGLASNANRKFNNIEGRKYITTQSLKKLKTFIKDWSLDLTKGWFLPGSDKKWDISELRNNDDLINKFYDKIFYKERWIKENGIEQRLIVSFSPKYQEYQRNIRNKQIKRAQDIINNNPKKIKSNNENDPKRFITTTSTTENGEVASENHYSIDTDKIMEESKYDGLYAVCTNLEDDVEEIIKINKRRWEIEESFRIMKSEFKARPVYLSREDRIKAHFIICFLSLVIFRYLEKKINEEYTVEKIIDYLKKFNFNKNGNDYIPIYTRTDFTDLLHDKFGFRTDYEILSSENLRKILKKIKN